MTNLKKVGLTALAGSLVAVSAHAGEMSVSGAANVTYKTGGFEQSRKATYPDLAADQANGTPSFGSKYFYGYGRTYFVNFFINF